MDISIFGLGYVGTVSAGCLTRDGHRVIGVDPNPVKVDLINAGQTPVIEAEIADLIANGVASKRLHAISDAATAVAQSDISLICVGTPSNGNGSLDLRHVRAVCEQIGAALRQKSRYHVVVLRSTMLPGSMRETVIPLLEQHAGSRAGEGFGVCNNPEFLREGSAVYDYDHPPKIVVGESDSGAGDRLLTLYQALDAPRIRTDIETAEMVKYVDNVWHALKVGFANEVGALSKALQLDGQQVMSIFCQDQKLNLSANYLRPGFAFGGSCLPKDLRALNHRAKALDLELPILNAILPSNREQLQRAVRMVLAHGRHRVGILGMSFKAGTDDLRESPLVELIETLIGKGFDLRIYDHNVHLASLTGANRDYILHRIPHISRLLSDRLDAVLAHAETLVVGNDDAQFRQSVAALNGSHHIVDLVRIGAQRSAGNYEGIGW